MTSSHTVSISLETAILIRAAFLPHNPNKMRKADPTVVNAAWEFIRAVEKAKADAEARSDDQNVGGGK